MFALALCVCGVAITGGSDDSAAEGETYTIQYVVEGTTYSYTGAEASVVLKSAEDIGATIPEGKQMDGWTYMVGATPVMVGVGSTVILSSEAPTTFTAKLSDVEYTVVFMNGETVISTADYTYNGDVIVPADPSKEGYTFAGWDVEVVLKATADATYNATWTEIFTVKWVVETVTVATGSTESPAALDVPSDPSKESFRFLGWFDADGAAFSAEYVFEGDVVFTAAFSAEVYTVTFIYGEESTVYLTETVQHGDSAIKPSGMPEGYSAWDFDFATAITADTKIVAIEAPPEAPAVWNTSLGQCAIIIGAFVIGLFGWAAYTGKIALPKVRIERGKLE